MAEQPPFIHEDGWVGVPWRPDAKGPSLSLRRRVEEQDQQIGALQHQLDVLMAGDRAAGAGETQKKSKSKKEKSFSSRIIVEEPSNEPLSEFRLAFDAGELPIAEGEPVRPLGIHIMWTLPQGFTLRNLNFDHYLPLCMTGLVETEPPYDYVAEQACRDLIRVGGKHHRLHTVVDKCIVHLKNALKSEENVVVRRAMMLFNQLLVCDQHPDPEPEHRNGVARSSAGMMAVHLTQHTKGILGTLRMTSARLAKLAGRENEALKNEILALIEQLSEMETRAKAAAADPAATADASASALA